MEINALLMLLTNKEIEKGETFLLYPSIYPSNSPGVRVRPVGLPRGGFHGGASTGGFHGGASTGGFHGGLPRGASFWGWAAGYFL